MRNSFGIGDVVTYGKSNTEWEITEETEKGVYTLKSEKGSTKRNVSWDKLTLVRDAGPTLTDSQVEELDETYADHGMSAAQEAKREMLLENTVVAEWNNTYTVPSKPYTADLIQGLHPLATHVLHIDGKSEGFKSYGAAADALVLARREGFQHAAIDHDGRRLVERSAV